MKKKLRIEELKVQSFVTELHPETARTAKGGDGEESTPTCTAVTVAAWAAYT